MSGRTVVRLLGAPRLERDGVPVAGPRGRKSWALLGYLHLTGRPVPRRQLAELLFPDADDPLGTLRWALADLRRGLGGAVVVGGDPVGLELADGVVVDVEALFGRGAPPLPGAAVGELGELLDGVELDGCPVFASWLVAARHRTAAAVDAWLRRCTTGALAAGRAEEAVECAGALVVRDPYDEGNHELLVRSLAAAGDRPAALRQVAVSTELFRREVGVAVSPVLREAAAAVPRAATTAPATDAGAVAADLEAGRAAIAAGAVDAGLQCLRRAVVDVDRLADPGLQAQVWLAMGSALVHAVRGRDEEGAIALHRALAAAAACGDRAATVVARRELGFVEVQAGRRQSAERWLEGAQRMAETDAEVAGVLAVRGMNSSDAGRYPAALDQLGGSVTRARACGDQRQEAWSLSLVARVHLLRGEHGLAREAVRDSLDLVRAQRWLAFRPWPQALEAELQLAEGDVAQATEHFEQSWALACRIGDPCWEGMAARGLGLLRQRAGDDAGANHWLTEAVSRATRVTDRYQWVHAYTLDAAAAAAVRRGDRPRAARLTTTLLELAARGEMREMVARAHLHRHRLGARGALAAARLAAGGVDNPVLREELERA
jgi:DNA-binding SARP family transcriptional activator